MTPPNVRSAVLVDRFPLWLDALESVLASVPVVVTAKETSARAGLDAVIARRPDVLVTDLATDDGDLNGVALVERATNEVRGLRAIVVSAHENPTELDAAFAAGACAFVVKTAHPDDFAAAVRQAFHASIFVAGSVRPLNGSTPPAEATSVLTKREREVLRLVAEGYSNAALARQLWVTEQTVKFHLSNIYRKLGVPNRTGASRWAQMNGLLESRDVRSSPDGAVRPAVHVHPEERELGVGHRTDDVAAELPRARPQRVVVAAEPDDAHGAVLRVGKRVGVHRRTRDRASGLDRSGVRLHDDRAGAPAQPHDAHAPDEPAAPLLEPARAGGDEAEVDGRGLPDVDRREAGALRLELTQPPGTDPLSSDVVLARPPLELLEPR